MNREYLKAHGFTDEEIDALEQRCTDVASYMNMGTDESIQTMTNALIGSLIADVSIFSSLLNDASWGFRNAPRRIVHLAFCHKKSRVRKKNQKRLLEYG